MLKKIEHLVEGALWSSRLCVIVAVVASLIACIATFAVSTVDFFRFLGDVWEYITTSTHGHGLDHGHATGSDHAGPPSRTDVIVHVVEVIDGYLLGTILLIFSFGLYELFISKIDIAEKNQQSSRVLLIHTLDDLKDRLAKVVLLILVVKFFEHAIQMQFKTALDLLFLSLGVCLIALSLFLGHWMGHGHGDDEHGGGNGDSESKAVAKKRVLTDPPASAS